MRLSVLQDDFYYYSKIAQNISNGQGSTFNGLYKTNGYHPLWLLTLVPVWKAARSIYDVIYAVEIAGLLACVAIFFSAKRVISRVNPDPLQSNVVASVIALMSAPLMFTGMEVILCVPLAMTLSDLVIWSPQRWSFPRSLALGFLASLTILSRLDSILLVALLGCGTLWRGRANLKETVRWMAPMTIGLLPVAVYLSLNHLRFGAWMPVSGSAKQLRLNHHLSLRALKYVFQFGLSLDVCVVVVSFALLLFVSRLGDRLARASACIIPVLVFPFIHLAVISQLSDWALWPWYMYGWIIALPFAFAFLFEIHRSFVFKNPIVTRIAWSALIVVGGLEVKHQIGFSVRGKIPTPATRVVSGMFIAAFMDAHPGIYAMGDRSGIVGQSAEEPIIQTEGLVMDGAFLAHLRHEDPLLDVLHSYKVRYYVASVRPDAVTSPCLDAVEPAQAGPSSAHMRGKICGIPVASTTTGDYTTLIYDLSKLEDNAKR